MSVKMAGKLTPQGVKIYTPASIPTGIESLLLHMDTSGFVDSSGNNVALLANQGVTQDTVNKKFGVSAASFDATTDVLRYQNSDLFTLGTEPFIIDMWVRITGDTALNMANTRVANLISSGIVAGSNVSTWNLNLAGSSTVTGTGFGFGVYTATGTSLVAGVNYTFSKNTWYHIAVSRTSAGVIQFHVNGVLINKTYDTIGTSTAITNRLQYPVRLGSTEISGWLGNFVGQLDEVRVIKGSWLPESFTPPAAPYI